MPHNCSILNQTTDSFYIECIDGFDGGLPQKFTIRIDREISLGGTKSTTTIHNQTSKVASFAVNNLEPGTTYEIQIYASNTKGNSEIVHFSATTLNLPERRTGESRNPRNEKFRFVEKVPRLSIIHITFRFIRVLDIPLYCTALHINSLIIIITTITLPMNFLFSSLFSPSILSTFYDPFLIFNAHRGNQIGRSLSRIYLCFLFIYFFYLTYIKISKE